MTIVIVNTMAEVPLPQMILQMTSYSTFLGLALVGTRMYRYMLDAKLAAHQERLQALEQLAESERLRARAALERAEVERLVLVGQLAAGVAHEVNNPLAFVKANLSYLQRETEDETWTIEREEFRDVLEETKQGVMRIQQIVTDLGGFSRANPMGEQQEPGVLEAALEEAKRLASVRLREGGEVALELAAELPTVRLGQRHMVQVLVNLLINAADAAQSAQPPRRPHIKVRANQEAGGVCLRVEDNGPGIPPDVLPRLFDPFFTTKPPRPGNGAGARAVPRLRGARRGHAPCGEPPRRGLLRPDAADDLGRPRLRLLRSVISRVHNKNKDGDNMEHHIRAVPAALSAALLSTALLAGPTTQAGVASTSTRPQLTRTQAGVASTSTRPQLTRTQASHYTIDRYMAQAGTIGSLSTDNWDPTEGVGSGFTANYTVAADGSASYRTLQAAINAAVSAGGTSRKYISVKAGTYRELVCVPASAPPITLYGLDSTASNTVIVYNNANPTPKPSGSNTHPCVSNASATTVGTVASATFTILAKDFRARNLTFSNDYVEGTYSGSNQSAVALASRGDKAIFENVLVLGNQDTLYLGANSSTTVVRSFFRSSFIKGDTDFIFGHGAAAFSGCTIQYTASRLGSSASSYIFAPSTRPGSNYGFLVINSTLNSTGSAGTALTYLARAWDESVGSLSNYVNGTSPNGQLVIRDSLLGGHIRGAEPYAKSTIGRSYCSSNCTYSANRFYEYNNSGAGNGG